VLAITAGVARADTFYVVRPVDRPGGAAGNRGVRRRAARRDRRRHAVQRIVDPGPLTVVAVEELELPPGARMIA